MATRARGGSLPEVTVADDILRVVRATARPVPRVTWKRIRLSTSQTCALCWSLLMVGETVWFCREQMVCECVPCRAEADRADRARREGGAC